MASLAAATMSSWILDLGGSKMNSRITATLESRRIDSGFFQGLLGKIPGKTALEITGAQKS